MCGAGSTRCQGPSGSLPELPTPAPAATSARPPAPQHRGHAGIPGSRAAPSRRQPSALHDPTGAGRAETKPKRGCFVTLRGLFCFSPRQIGRRGGNQGCRRVNPQFLGSNPSAEHPRPAAPPGERLPAPRQALHTVRLEETSRSFAEQGSLGDGMPIRLPRQALARLCSTKPHPAHSAADQSQLVSCNG